MNTKSEVTALLRSLFILRKRQLAYNVKHSFRTWMSQRDSPNDSFAK